MWTLITLLLTSRVAIAACESSSTRRQLQAQMDAAEKAYENLDAQGFGASSDAVRFLLPCLAEPMDTTLAAAVHRLEGLRAFGERDQGGAARAFAAARWANTDYRFPESLIPPNHPVQGVYTSFPLDSGVTATVEVPPGLIVSFDGRMGTERPMSWPVLVQVLDEQQAVLYTAWLEAGDPLLDLEAMAPAQPLDVAVKPERQRSREPRDSSRTVRISLAATAGGAALASGLMYGLAASSSSRYWDPATPEPDLEGLRARTNTLAIGSGAAGAVAVVAGAGFAFTGEW